MRPLLSSLFVGLLLALAAHAAEEGEGCGRAGRVRRFEAVTPEGDVMLAQEGPARLAGLRLPEAPWREAALAALAARAGQDVQAVGPDIRDRWGRRVVRLLAGGHDLGEYLVAAGLALVDPGSGNDPCARGLLAAEAQARARGLGLWAGDRYTPIPVAELARLRERIGRFVLVEGRVRSIGERPQQTYLNFSSEWASDFTIIVPKRVWGRMADLGLGAAGLKGRLIRARGILEDRQGPALTLTGPDVMEVVDEGRGR